jgi:hypothetical protein
VQVRPLLPAPADSVGTQISGGDSKNPNLITRRWGSDLSLFTAPADSVGTQASGGGSKNPNLITQWWGSDLYLLPAPNKSRVNLVHSAFVCNLSIPYQADNL